MPLDLSSVQGKIERGYEHLETLQAEVVTWVQRYPYGLRHETHEEGRMHTGTLRVYRQPDSTRFGLLIGDCAGNFRSALDHLIVAVGRSGLPEDRFNKVEDSLAFPICTTPDRWVSALARERLDGAGIRVLAEVERRQPYRAADPTNHLLYALHWLNNRDKHRVLHAIAAFPQVATIDFIPELPGPNEGAVAPPPYEDGTQVFWARSAVPCPDVQMKADMVMEIRVRETPRPEDIRELLLQIGQLVQHIVTDVAKAHLTDTTTHS